MGRAVLLVGGLGYVGYNLARLLSQRGVEVLVAARRSSAEKRPAIAKALGAMHGVRVVYLEGDEAGALLRGHGCPDTAYILVGRIRGGRRELYASNLEAPLAWARALAEHCGGVETVFTSVLTVYARRGSLEPEKPHGKGLKPRSLFTRLKLEAERRLLALCPRIFVKIARMGMFAGRRPYHVEWRLLTRIARLGIVLGSDAWLHLTTARGLLEAAEKLVPCSWDTVVTVSATVHSFTWLLANRAASRRVYIPAPGRRAAGAASRLMPGLAGEAASVASTPPPRRLYGGQSLEEVVEEVLVEPPSP